MSTLVELAAYTCFVVAGWLVTPVLGLVVAGGALLLIAHALEGTRLPRVRAAAVSGLVAQLRARASRLRLPKLTWPRGEATEP